MTHAPTTHAMVLYRRPRRWRVPVAEHHCRACGGIFLIPRGASTQGRVFCSRRCAVRWNSWHMPQDARIARARRAAAYHAARTRAKAGAALALRELDGLREFLDAETRTAMTRALARVHQAAYRLGYAAGARHARAVGLASTPGEACL